MTTGRAVSRHRHLGAALLATFLGLALLTALAPPDSGADKSALVKARSCRDVVVQFEPEGSGGATEILAKRIKCRKARKVLKSCLFGKLKPGWTGSFLDPDFQLRKARKRIRFALVGGGGCIDIPRAAGKPAPPKGADRVQRFKENLDGDAKKEVLFVYNLTTDGAPASYLEVWNHKHGEWKPGQQKLVNQVPSQSSSAGLVKAWAGDLNKDGLVEAAVLDFVSPSFGETLLILRQKSATSRRFESLQSLGGDAIDVQREQGKPAVIEIFRKANHSPDNAEHTEKWKWSEKADAWTCRKDCAPI